MTFDYATLDILRQNHPAWRLLRSDHAPLVAGFLHRVFVAPNVRLMAQADLAEMLEDELFALREQLGSDAFPRPALHYLNDWAAPDKGWLRKFYQSGSDEPFFDLTPSTEKAITWLGTLAARSFVGTESRLLTLIDLLRQISAGSEADPDARLADLYRRRHELDLEISRIQGGDVPLLDDTALKERFQQFQALARELLTDFREVEQNFRLLDRRVRERIALWAGSKGALLEDVMGERDAIADSDQGRSFRAFWDFLMSSSRQEELTQLLERVLTLPPVIELRPEPRTRRIHYDWLEAGEHTQRTVAQLSQQLRRFLDDQAWLENRRIMDILRGIEAKALELRRDPPTHDIMDMAATGADIRLPMERPLHTPTARPLIVDTDLSPGHADLDASALFGHTVIDKARLEAAVRHALQDKAQITLAELCNQHPLRHGLEELLTYLQLTGVKTVIDDNVADTIAWTGLSADGRTQEKQARLPRIIFVRES